MSRIKRAAIVMTIGLVGLGVGTIGTAGVASAMKPALPGVKSVTPEHGPINGGTNVVITGKHLGGIISVQFGSTPSTQVTPDSQSRIVAVSPPGTGTVDITVTTTAGTSAVVAADQFTYVTTPSIQNVVPGSGSTLGGNRVTISGAGFTGATAVTFGSVAATSFTVESDAEIVAETPAEPAGKVDVSVTAPSGTSPVDSADTFTFSAKVPIVTSVAPDVGSVSGGTTVTITGKRFTHVAAVDFGSTPASSYTVTNSKSIIAVSPAGTGTVDVTVTNASGQSGVNNPADGFSYQPES